jgi:hypothetical protein
MRPFPALATLVLASCGTSSDDVVGPFTGDTHRYALDAIEFPTSHEQALDFGGDLDGDGTPDNQLGSVFGNLAAQHNINEHAFDIIAGGVIATSLEITADDPLNDSTVGVRYLGTPDSPFVELGGKLSDGWFRSNRTATTNAPGEADLLLPVFDDADPTLIHAVGVELELIPDTAGGYTAHVHGVIPRAPAAVNREFMAKVYQGIVQMIASEPSEHRVFTSIFDADKDGTISFDEVLDNSLLTSLLAPDVSFDGAQSIAVGFRAHFRPCPSGQCPNSEPFDSCFDRKRDGDETDVDCGGSCRGCEAGASCVTASDCETTTCDQGHCGPPSCSDGVKDGLESDVDCGANCGRCATGKRCYLSTDCTSGKCGAPCMSSNPLDCPIDLDSDTCFSGP